MSSKDYADPIALLEYDPAGVVIRATGNDVVLDDLDRFATSLKYYVDMMKSNSMVRTRNAAINQVREEEEEEEEADDDRDDDSEDISSRPDPVASSNATRPAAVSPVANAARASVQDPPFESDESDNDSDDDSDDDDDDDDDDSKDRERDDSTKLETKGVAKGESQASNGLESNDGKAQASDVNGRSGSKEGKTSAPTLPKKKKEQQTPDGSNSARAKDSGKKSSNTEHNEETTKTTGNNKKQPNKASGGVRDAKGRFPPTPTSTSNRATESKKNSEAPSQQTPGESKKNSKSTRQQTAGETECNESPPKAAAAAATQKQKRRRKESGDDSDVANKRRRKLRKSSSGSRQPASEKEEEKVDSKQKKGSVVDRSVKDPSNPTLLEKIQASPLQYSVGVSRKEVSQNFKDLGLSSKCSLKVISKAKGKRHVSHLTFRHDTIDFPFDDRQKKFEWRVVEGEHTMERQCMSLFLDPAKQTQEELPVFLYSKGSGTGHSYVPHKLFYVGHFLCTSFEMRKHVFEGISRRAILKFKFVGFHKTLAKKMAELA